MKFEKNKVFVSTVAEDARDAAVKHGLGLEIAEFCTAMNMDTMTEIPEHLAKTGLEPGQFAYWDSVVREKLRGISGHMFHAPFNELCPAAIEPRVYEVTRARFRQAAKLAQTYGARRMVVHSGYVPLIYFKGYFAERSVVFWKELLEELPADFTLLLENVMEDGPELLTGIVRDVNDERFRMCLDIGHANHIASKTPVEEWIDAAAPYIGHLHIHNNYREWDDHNPVYDGTFDARAIMEKLLSQCREDTTCTIESLRAMPTADWLADEGFL